MAVWLGTEEGLVLDTVALAILFPDVSTVLTSYCEGLHFRHLRLGGMAGDELSRRGEAVMGTEIDLIRQAQLSTLDTRPERSPWSRPSA